MVFGLFRRKSSNVSGDLDRQKSNVAERAAALAAIRGEALADVFARYSPDELKRCPKRFSPRINYLRRVEIEDSGVDDDLAWVRIEGRTVYGEPSKPSHERQYRFVSDLVSPNISAPTFLTAMDVATRYMRNTFETPFEIPIHPGYTVVEVGAFAGHLSLWFADTVGPSGRVVAIEMMPENARILRKNVEANQLEDIVTVIEAGAWSEPGEHLLHTKGLQRASLVEIDSVREGQGMTVPVNTLDNILRQADVDDIDVAFITVNGAEQAVLQGFSHFLTKTRSVAISAPYTSDGSSHPDACARTLKDAGFEIAPSPNPNLVVAYKR